MPNCHQCNLPLEGEGVKPFEDREWRYHQDCIDLLKIEHAGFVRHAEKASEEARSEGRLARLDGHPRESNPHKGFGLEQPWYKGWDEVDVDPQAPKEPLPVPAPLAAETTPAPEPGPFDPLFVTPERAAELEATRGKNPEQKEEPAPPGIPDKQDEEDEDHGELLSEAVTRITVAIERLAKKGLNLRAVVALIHDANPKLSKKQIKGVLEALRELPAIYGRDTRSPHPLRK